MPDELPELIVPDAVASRVWLHEHQAAGVGVWLRLAKKGTTVPTRPTCDQALDEALCSGWIDGQVRRADQATFAQRFTPRRPRSVWSHRNTGLIERLTAQGRMQSAGLAQVERAKADRRWARRTRDRAHRHRVKQATMRAARIARIARTVDAPARGGPAPAPADPVSARLPSRRAARSGMLSVPNRLQHVDFGQAISIRRNSRPASWLSSGGAGRGTATAAVRPITKRRRA